MLIKVHTENPSARRIGQIVEVLLGGGVIIYPTDTVYALACSMEHKKAFEHICRLKGVAPAKAMFSMLFADLKQVANYTAQIDTSQYRILRKHLPGPFTFILKTGSTLPAYVRAGRKTIGIRIPDHEVSYAIVSALGHPLLTTSLRSDDEILEYYNDPSAIYEEFGKRVDLVVDAGPGTFHPSTVVDLTAGEPEVLRQGRGEM